MSAQPLSGQGFLFDQELDAIRLALGGISAKLGSPAAAPVEARPAPVLPRGYDVPWPVNFQSFLEGLLAAADTGEVTPFYDRGHLAVPAGSTKVLYAAIPSGSTGFIVFRHTMYLDPGQGSAAVTVTHQQDTQPPLIANDPLTTAIVVEGAFLLPAHNRVVHTVVNSSSVDVGFNDDAQVALITQDYYQAVVAPILRQNKALAGALAAGIVGGAPA